MENGDICEGCIKDGQVNGKVQSPPMPLLNVECLYTRDFSTKKRPTSGFSGTSEDKTR